MTRDDILVIVRMTTDALSHYFATAMSKVTDEMETEIAKDIADELMGEEE